MSRSLIWLNLALAGMLLGGCTSRGTDKPESEGSEKAQFAFITNGVADFWKPAAAGAEKAGEELGVDVTVIMPSGLTDQTRKIEDLLSRGTDGIAISPIDPQNQGGILNQAAEQTKLVTHDSDAPDSDRLVYIGMDNYKAGLMCGELARKALPDGGKIMILVGRLDQDNAQRRRQGFIDALLELSPDSRRHPSGKPLTSADGKYTILGTLTDQFDRAKAKANAEDALTRHPDLTAMVGLFEYNPPLILEALDRAGKLKQVKVIAFDENDATLQGIKDGTVVGTIVQDPYGYGHESIQVLSKLHNGDVSAIPESKFIDIPARVIDASNVTAFWDDLNAKLGKSK
ncbi:MAG: sugar-binding protein [Pirellulales bacterium]